MEVISNDPIQEDKSLKKLEQHPALQEQILFSDLTGSDLDKCEKAIQRCQSVTEVTNLAIALAVRHIVIEGLYKPEFSTHTEYFRECETRLKMSKQDASKYLNSGIAYYEFRKQLDTAGFRPEKDFSKLLLLPRAYEKYGDKAFTALCLKSAREFREYVIGGSPEQLNYTKLDLKVEITDKGISVEGREIITLKKVKEIVDSGAEPYLVALDSSGEKSALNRFLKDFRSKK